MLSDENRAGDRGFEESVIDRSRWQIAVVAVIVMVEL